MSEKGHAVAVLVVNADRKEVPLVRDPHKPEPHYWKIPGGRSEPGETAEETAVREIKEEVGITLDPTKLEVIHCEDRGTHLFTFFYISVPGFLGLKEKGDDGEEVSLFTLTEIQVIGTEGDEAVAPIFPPHWALFDIYDIFRHP